MAVRHVIIAAQVAVSVHRILSAAFLSAILIVAASQKIKRYKQRNNYDRPR